MVTCTIKDTDPDTARHKHSEHTFTPLFHQLLKEINAPQEGISSSPPNLSFLLGFCKLT